MRKFSSYPNFKRDTRRLRVLNFNNLSFDQWFKKFFRRRKSHNTFTRSFSFARLRHRALRGIYRFCCNVQTIFFCLELLFGKNEPSGLSCTRRVRSQILLGQFFHGAQKTVHQFFQAPTVGAEIFSCFFGRRNKKNISRHFSVNERVTEYHCDLGAVFIILRTNLMYRR